MNYSPSILDRTSIRLTGAVYTPSGVADAIVSYCMSKVEAKQLRVLEPSVGDGAFLRHLCNFVDVKAYITAVDIDSETIDSNRQMFSGYEPEVELLAEDFITFSVDHVRSNEPSYDLIIGNPPFIRKHNFSPDIKAQLDEFADAFDYPRRELKNTWAAFLLAATKMVTNKGTVAFVLPYEILTVSYGQKLLSAILPAFERVDVFISDDKAFREIDQDAVILIAQKVTNEPAGLYLSKVSNFKKLSTKKATKVNLSEDENQGVELNSFLLPARTVTLLKKIRARTSSVSNYANSAPGIVSAANDFFIKSKKDAIELGLMDYGMPILRKGSFASRSPIFRTDDFQALEQKDPCYFMRFQGDKESFAPNIVAYLESGEALKIHERYKCRHRNNWYEVPLVKSEVGFFFKRSHSYPRLLINEADTLVTDSAYGLRLIGETSIKGLCFSFYNSLTMLFAELNGRFYGGGVLELSPTEFRGLPLVYHEPTKFEFVEFLNAHEDGDVETILDFGDLWLQKKLALTDTQILAVRAAWKAVRNHRLRHGRGV